MVDGYRFATENECHVSKGTSASEIYARSPSDSKEVRVKGRWPKMHAFVTCVQPAAVPSILCDAHVSLYYGLSKKGKGQVARNRLWPEQKRKRDSHNLAIPFYIMHQGHDKNWNSCEKTEPRERLENDIDRMATNGDGGVRDRPFGRGDRGGEGGREGGRKALREKRQLRRDEGDELK